MSQIRFHIGSSPVSEWEEEFARHGPGVHTAVARINELRKQYPSAAIRVERRGDVRIPNPVQMFRYTIKVKDGYIPVTDEEGVGLRRLQNTVIQSRPFQEGERANVIADILQMLPNAELIEERL